MSDPDQELFLYGKRLSECTREELEQFIRFIAPLMRGLYSPEQIHARAVLAVEKLKAS